MDSTVGITQPSDRFHKSKPSTKQIDQHITLTYKQIIKLIQEKDNIKIKIPTDINNSIQKINVTKSIIQYFINTIAIPSHNSTPKLLSVKNNEQSQQIHSQTQHKFTCNDCYTYEKNLQKLQSQIRNHIRTHQQLKLYQDGLEQKIQQFKKNKKQSDKKYQCLKKKYQDIKNHNHINLEKISKLQCDNQKLKNDLKNNKNHSVKTEETIKQMNRYESNKQNLCQYRNTNNAYVDKQRSSIEKRPESSDRMRVSINVRSNKGISINKLAQEKIKQEKNKAIKSRLGF